MEIRLDTLKVEYICRYLHFYLLSIADCAYNQLVVEIQSGSAVSVCHFLLG